MEQVTTLRDYMKVLFRQKSVVLACFVTVMVTVIIGLMLKTPMYESSVKMLISGEKQVDSPYYRDIIASRNIEAALTQSEIVKSNAVMELSVRALGLNQKPLDYERRFASPLKKIFVSLGVMMYENKLKKIPEDAKASFRFQVALEELKQLVKVEPLRDTNMFVISVRDYSPVGAAIIANVVSRSYVIFDLQQQVAELQLKYGEKHSTVQQLKDNIDKMTKNLTGQTLPTVDAIGPASVKIIEQATPAMRPSGPSNALMVILAFFMSIFLGVMLAFMFEYMDQTFKSPHEIEQFLNLPYLGFISHRRKKDKPLVKDSDKITPYVNSFQALGEQFQLVMRDKNLKSILFTAAEKDEGVTTVVANLGTVFASAKRKTLIIDANMRHPGIHSAFSVVNNLGLSGVLEGKASLDECLKTVNDNLTILRAGKSDLNPITMLESQMIKEVLKTAKSKYDIVLIDCSQLRDYKDSVVLSALVDATTVVVSEGTTRRQVVQHALAPLIEKKANLIGAVLNNRSFVLPNVIYERV